MIYQLFGLGRIAPVYNALSIVLQTAGSNVGQTIPQHAAKALLPGIIGGYLLPSALLFYPFKDKTTWQGAVALWQPFPVYVGLLTTGLSRLYRASSQSDEKVEAGQKKTVIREQQKKKREAGLRTLRRVYALGFGVSALWHVGSLLRISSTPGQSISNVLGALDSPFANKSGTSSGFSMPMFFKWDLALACASTAVQSVHRIWELRSHGYVTTASALRATLLAAVGSVAVGPAATQLGVMAWREEVMVGLAR